MGRLVPHKIEPYTYREYALLPEDGQRHELIEGELYRTPAPPTTHQSLSSRLLRILAEQLEDTGKARVFAAPTDVILSRTDWVQPDLVVVRTSNASIITERAIEGVPDLVVEILSKSNEGNDRFLKRARYARLGIPEYWIVEPSGWVTVYRSASPQVYDLEARFDRARVLTSEELPELEILLCRIFR